MVDTTKSFTKQVLKLTNDFRKENGLDPLKWDPELADAAQKHSNDMGEQDFFSHTGKDGSQPWDRTKAAGDDNTRVGENIAAGQRTPEEVVQGWIKSPGHRANMLNPNYEYLGVGYHQEKPDKGSVNYQHYWTQNFGGGGTPPSGDPGTDPIDPGTDPTEPGTDPRPGCDIGSNWIWNWKHSGFTKDGVSSNSDKDMLVGQTNNEVLAGDFGNKSIVMNETYGGLENYKTEFIWGHNQNFQNQNFQKQADSMLLSDANCGSLGTCQLSPENWMGSNNNSLTELNDNQGDLLAELTKHANNLTSVFG